jgi:hypothetical protein
MIRLGLFAFVGFRRRFQEVLDDVLELLVCGRVWILVFGVSHEKTGLAP